MDSKHRYFMCVVCDKPLDTHAPHAIVKHDYAHLLCANEYDSQDLGACELVDDLSIPLLEDVE